MAKIDPAARRARLNPEFEALTGYTETMLFGEIWERPGLSKRDRSLITVAALITAYRPEQLRGHIKRALANGVTKEEIREVITHLAFYAGWASAMTAAHCAMDVYEEMGEG